MDAIFVWPRPENLTLFRAWLGQIGYYRLWIPQFIGRAGALFGLMKTENPSVWTATQQDSFDALKNSLTSPPILGIPLDDGYYVLDTDYSDCALGTVLQQHQGYCL